MLRGEYETDGVSLSVPVRLGGGGARVIEEWDLSAADLQALHAAARFVREAAGGL
jgi:malate/lactate dehydrogenase